MRRNRKISQAVELGLLVSILLAPGGVNSQTMGDLLLQAEKQPAKLSTKNVTHWSVTQGETVRDILYRWAKQEGWDLLWQADYDIKISAAANFEGNLATVVKQLLTSVNLSGTHLFAKMYMGNKVLVISTGVDNS